MQMWADFSPNAYNELMLVNEANTSVRSRKDFPEFLSLCAALFSRYNLEDTAGVFLLHRHNRVSDSEVMVETDGLFEGCPALVTRPVELLEGIRSVPTRWAVCGNRFIPMEYSEDASLARGAKRIIASEDFLEDFASLLRRYRFERELGLCIFDRDYFHADKSGMILVEETDIETASNVVRWVAEVGDPENLIETVWHFASTTSGPACVPLCKQYCYWLSPGHAIGHYYTHGIIA